MEISRVSSGHFNRYAFVWKPAFGQRQANLYLNENMKFVDESRNPAMTTGDIINRFISCRGRDLVHLSRKLQVGNFLEGADIDILRGQSRSPVLKPMVLLDDRNSGSVTTGNLNGDCRPNGGPLDACQLYTELSQEACRLSHSSSSDSNPASSVFHFITTA